MTELRYSRDFHVFRQRDEGVWIYMGQETIQSTRPIAVEETQELVVRGFMGRGTNNGGTFAVVPADQWRLVDARKPEPEVKPSSKEMKVAA